MPTPSFIDRRLWTNLFQVGFGLVGSAVGVAYALQLQAPVPWLAALAGAWIGFLLFVLISGALLVFVPPAHTHRFISYKQYVRLNRAARIALWIYIATMPVTFVAMVALGFRKSGTLWIIGFHGLTNLYARFCQARLEDIGCPHCRGKFGFQSPFEVDDHRCGDCGCPFVMEPGCCDQQPPPASPSTD